MTRQSGAAGSVQEAPQSYPPPESRIHTTPVMEKVPARIIQAHHPDHPIDVTVQRFMGVLVHPVPSREMQDKDGIFRPGGKVYLDWSRDCPAWFHVEVGDRLEVVGRAFRVIGLDEMPVVYSALYVREV